MTKKQEFFHWNNIHQAEEGVITGCDENQEWMLRWWWNHYSKTNNLPVAFFDFGMSKSAIAWCKKKGTVINCPSASSLITPKEKISKLKWKMWERVYPGDIEKIRQGSFSKALALPKTPYRKTIWVDLDTKIQKSISSLFSYCKTKEDFAIAQAPLRYQKSGKITGLYLPKETIYNSGVFVFMHNSSLVQKWIQNIHAYNHNFLGDEDVLTRTIYEEKYRVAELPSIYNWSIYNKNNPDAAILHYLGAGGKRMIFSEI